MEPRKVMIHIESLNDVPVRILRKKQNLLLTVRGVGCEDLEEDLNIDQITVQVVKPEK